MGRIFGFVVGVIWLGFTFWAFSTASAGRSAGAPDMGFWWTVIGAFYGLAAMVALVGTARHKVTGPVK